LRHGPICLGNPIQDDAAVRPESECGNIRSRTRNCLIEAHDTSRNLRKVDFNDDLCMGLLSGA
jgi:hypothetical protein